MVSDRSRPWQYLSGRRQTSPTFTRWVARRAGGEDADRTNSRGWRTHAVSESPDEARCLGHGQGAWDPPRKPYRVAGFPPPAHSVGPMQWDHKPASSLSRRHTSGTRNMRTTQRYDRQQCRQ